MNDRIAELMGALVHAIHPHDLITGYNDTTLDGEVGVSFIRRDVNTTSYRAMMESGLVMIVNGFRMLTDNRLFPILVNPNIRGLDGERFYGLININLYVINRSEGRFRITVKINNHLTIGDNFIQYTHRFPNQIHYTQHLTVYSPPPNPPNPQFSSYYTRLDNR
jgi:hypothetical protein